jgi:putative lipoic acid-binding regulatory protein
MNPKNQDQSNPGLLEFPCEFPIKAMGKSNGDFERLVTGIVCAHADLWSENSVRTVSSNEGNYLSVTVIVNATSQEQLDAIYQDLTDCPEVLMAL